MDLAVAELRKKVVAQIKEVLDSGKGIRVNDEYPYDEPCNLCGKEGADTAIELKKGSHDYPIRLHPFCWMVIRAELDYEAPKPISDDMVGNVDIEGKAYDQSITIEDGLYYSVRNIRDPALAHLIRGTILRYIRDDYPKIIDKAVRHSIRTWEKDNGPWEGRD